MGRRTYGPIGRKQITIWDFWRSHVKITWRVYIAPKDKKISFQACTSVNGRFIHLENHDLFKLQSEARQVSSGVGELTWSRKIVVTVLWTQRKDEDDYSGISVRYYPIEITTDENGKKLRRMPGKDNMRCDWPKTRGYDDDVTYDNAKGVTAMINDTPEHRAALEAICTGISMIASRLMALMNQKNIKNTLVNIRPGEFLPLLSAPAVVKSTT